MKILRIEKWENGQMEASCMAMIEFGEIRRFWAVWVWKRIAPAGKSHFDPFWRIYSWFWQISPGEIIVQASLQWHSRLARRTYKSVLTKKCEGREFEPPLEQGFSWWVPIRSQWGHMVMIHWGPYPLRRKSRSTCQIFSCYHSLKTSFRPMRDLNPRPSD